MGARKKIVPLEIIITAVRFEIQRGEETAVYTTTENWRAAGFGPYNTSLKIMPGQELLARFPAPKVKGGPFLQFHIHYDPGHRDFSVTTAGIYGEAPVAYTDISGKEVKPEFLEAIKRDVQKSLERLMFYDTYAIYEKFLESE